VPQLSTSITGRTDLQESADRRPAASDEEEC